MKKQVLFLTMLIGIICFAQDKKDPSFEDMLSLSSVSNAQISPDGQQVLFEQRTTDWDKNRYDRELWIAKVGQTPFQLTNNTEGNSSRAKWSPDGQWIGFLSKRGEETQLFVIRAAGGEAHQITETSSGVSDFEWSPDGKVIAFTQSEDKSEEEEKRKEKYGAFAFDDQEYSLTQLWTLDFQPDRLGKKLSPEQSKDSLFTESLKPKLLLDSVAFTINDFKWSPDGKKMAIEHQPDPLINSFFKADISIITLATKKVKLLISHPSYDGLVDWSPDSKSILYQTSLADSISNYYKNGKLFRIDIDGSKDQQLASKFDEDIYGIQWHESGIYGLAWQRSLRPLLKINPKNGKVTQVSSSHDRIWNYTLSKDGKSMAYTGATDTGLTEVYLSEENMKNPRQLSSSTNQINNWMTAQSEMISWKSEDGALIEGVLHKPQNYDPNKKYPLLVVIHGGPTGISTPSPVPSYVYPMVQWLNKGALILRPNYRGSAGYGEAFRSLNVRNLGVGDAWDVLSGVEHLEKKGLIDGNKVGCMGWSQGGYISAFLTTNSNKFKAISVGAGISNWMTYYVNTDIHPFTRQYLKATPWSDEEIYRKTSPMTSINKATTPTLIQHGEFDRRVPTPNAYELYQGLKDVGVTTELVIYKGFGHGISKPKERLAATWHNWQWFARYIWDEEIELPEE